ncbi:MAG TPA: M48 family metallopeptidase [Allosphingosinicella sp.]|jgi:STE24 endopeptidase|nr:M48 family metallopeptidase [Allosphingosinicella sp.]
MITDILTASAVQAAAGGFDVEAATRAYLDTLQGAARERSDDYFEGGYWLLLWGTMVAVASSWVMLRLRWSAAWSRWAGRITRRRWLQPALYALPFVLVSTLIVLPWTIYTGWWRDKHYGLMNLSIGGWAAEQAIGLAIGIATTAILLAIVYTVIRKAPRSWWLWASGTMVAFLAVMILLSPVFIAPLFNEYRPMEAGPLRDEIIAMARAHDVPAEHVYVFDQSRQHNRISANVSGLGPTIRISSNDNLLRRGSPAEVKAVMGHELGHYVLGHVTRLFLVFGFIILAGFFLVWWLAPKILARRGEGWGVQGVADPASLPLLSAIFSVYILLATPLLNSLVRTNESAADAFGLEAAREPDGFASTAMKLSEYRKIEPSPLEEAIFFDHPSGRTRVRMAMEWKARHLAELPPEQRGIVRPPPPAPAPAGPSGR